MEELTIAMCLATLALLAISRQTFAEHCRQDSVVNTSMKGAPKGCIIPSVVSLNDILTNKLLNNDETKLT